MPRASELEPVLTLLTEEAIAAGLRELARIRDGFAPGEAELADAPVLLHWTAEALPGGLLCLICVVSGHPLLADGWCRTSVMLAADIEAGWGRTISRYYRIGPKLGEVLQWHRPARSCSTACVVPIAARRSRALTDTISARVRAAKWLSMADMTISAASVPAGSILPFWRRWKRLTPQFATAETFAQRLGTGWLPSPKDYADAPLLTDWRTP